MKTYKDFLMEENEDKFIGIASDIRNYFGTPKQIEQNSPINNIMKSAKNKGINITSDNSSDFLNSLKENEYAGFIEFNKQYNEKVEKIDQIELFKKLFGEQDVANFQEIIKKKQPTQTVQKPTQIQKPSQSVQKPTQTQQTTQQTPVQTQTPVKTTQNLPTK